MNERQLKDIFRQGGKFASWKSIFDFVFGKVEYFSTPNNPFSEDKKVIAGKQFGRIKLDDGKFVALFEVEVNDSIDIENNRQGLRDIAARHIDQNINHAALVLYYSPNQQNYRLTFIAKWSGFDEETGELQKGETQKKRYTYLFGGSQSGTTAAKRLLELANKKPTITIKDIIGAFSVEALTKEFFKKYKEHYERFWRFIDAKTEYRILLLDTSNEKSEDEQKKPIRDFSKKLLGRIVFLHFLQKKGWMGCPVLPTQKENDEIWENGNPSFMLELFENFKAKDQFYSKCLTVLFFNTLNQPGRTNNVFSVTNTRVPYLNGGLFDNDQRNTDQFDFPSQYFHDLLEFFEQYNFTIDENSPDEQEVGIDPEMLGHIFENLLEENREKGAFYTPKEIVQYMCQESLIQYLKNHLPSVSNIEDFIKRQQVSDYLEDKRNAIILNSLLDEVKVCDPAIGSGAFPIGILQEIYKAKIHIYPYLKSSNAFNPAETKKKIIEESIHGVDLEHGAVEIARLRFWLALVVDEDVPHPLPNLDYKIMQGNSLLERFEGINLKFEKKIFEKKIEKQRNLFGEINNPQISLTEYLQDKQSSDEFDIISLEDEYFNTTNAVKKAEIRLKIQNIESNFLREQLEKKEKSLRDVIANKEYDYLMDVANTTSEAMEIKLSTGRRAKELFRLKVELGKVLASRESLSKIHRNGKPYFLWGLYFIKIFDKGGFDIVIGNPPYIQLQKLGKEADKLEDAGFSTFVRTGDIYCLFYEKGFELLKPSGVLTFITSNKWMRGAYGKRLRSFFSQKNTKKIINLGPRIFHSATVDTNVFIGTNEASKNVVHGISVEDRNAIMSLQDSALIPLNDMNEEAWIILDKDELNINQAFQNFGRPLRDWDISINFGIKTGYNEAFIIDKVKRNELTALDPNSKEIIKPILKGREVEKYFAKWQNDFLINTHNGIKSLKINPIDINKYPAIKNHLESEDLWEKVRLRQDQGDTPYNLRNCAYLPEFKKEKVIWKRIGSLMRFAYSDEELYCLDSTCIATGEKIKYLTAVLNSKAGLYQLFKTSPQTGTGDQIISVQALEPLLVHYPSDIIEEKFNRIVDIILFLKKASYPFLNQASNEEISLLFESIVDQMVFELYFENHMKELEIDIFKDFNFPELSKIKIDSDKKEAIIKSWYWLQEKENPIRNKILVSESRSWIIKRINLTVSQQ